MSIFLWYVNTVRSISAVVLLFPFIWVILTSFTLRYETDMFCLVLNINKILGHFPYIIPGKSGRRLNIHFYPSKSDGRQILLVNNCKLFGLLSHLTVLPCSRSIFTMSAMGYWALAAQRPQPCKTKKITICSMANHCISMVVINMITTQPKRCTAMPKHSVNRIFLL